MEILSLGAGVQSSVLALMAAKGEITLMPDAAIFADTGWEPKYVYDWLDWLEKQLPFPVYRVQKGNLRQDIENCIIEGRFASIPFFTETGKTISSGKRKGMNQGGRLRRQCTREYKVEPVVKKIRELVGLKPRQWAKPEHVVTQWIGISLDEIIRMKPSRDWWINNRWPLIEKKMTRYDCLQWMEKNGYPLPQKSSCIGCPYHDNATWRDMKLNRPDEWADAVKIDSLIRNGVRGTKEKLYLHCSLVPLEDIDFRNAEDLGQQVLEFGEECEGMCGV